MRPTAITPPCWPSRWGGQCANEWGAAVPGGAVLWVKAAASCIPEQVLRRPRFCCGWTCVYQGARGAVAQISHVLHPQYPPAPPAFKAPFATSCQHQP